MTDRRTVLQGFGAAALGLSLTPARAQTAPRVVIVGAGMAGLAAARVFSRRRVPFVLIEARDRIGGRAFTDSKALGMPFDRGCSFLHLPRNNPLVPRAAELGFTVAGNAAHPVIYFGGESEGARAVKAFDTAYSMFARGVAVAGAHGDDLAASDLVSVRTVWDRLAAYAMGPEQTGVALNQLSTLDWYSQLAVNGGREGRVREGLGNMVAAFGAHIPVSLSTSVSRIDWRGTNVRVETSGGAIMAECCLLTVPVGVLRAGAIGFAPALPQAKLSAIAGIGTGVVNKTALAFRPGALPPERDVWFYQLRKDGMIADVLVRPFGYDMTVHFTGGDFAREVELLNRADQITLALATIGDIYGNETAAGCIDGAVTRWASDPFSLGSHSAALPGQAHRRAELGKPVAERLYFAGEACAASWAASLPGAFLSGHATAGAIADRLG
ncbi:MAG TPA: FAD-dependent oxidoreductase [Rhizomicrobium sp.]